MASEQMMNECNFVVFVCTDTATAALLPGARTSFVQAGRVAQTVMERRSPAAGTEDGTFLGFCPLGGVPPTFLSTCFGTDAVVLHALAGGLVTEAMGGTAEATDVAIRASAAEVRRMLITFVESKVPGYMVPSDFVAVEAIPRTDNGKVDRKALVQLAMASETDSNAQSKNKGPATSLMELALLELWQITLNKSNVSVDDDFFFDLGGDSLGVVRLVTIAQQRGLKITASQVFQTKTIRVLAAHTTLVGSGTAASQEEVVTAVCGDANEQMQPFAVTDIQRAYIRGRDKVFMLGNVSAHNYSELLCKNLDVRVLSEAWQALIDRHGMLRCVARDEEQCILPGPLTYHIVTTDLSSTSHSKDRRDAVLLATREAMSHQMFDLTVWPLFDVRVTVLPDGESIVHFSYDLFILDATSVFLLLEEWAQLYREPTLPLEPLEISFRDYMKAHEVVTIASARRCGVLERACEASARGTTLATAVQPREH
jgi:acyl carrier protein